MSSTVTINTRDYTIYGSFDDAEGYWNGLLGVNADRWRDSDLPTKQRALVQAGLLLDRLTYVDAAATFVLRDALSAFPKACYEIAGSLIVDPTVFSSITSGSNVRKVQSAGGDTIEFFNPTLGITGRFPVNIQELIGPYIQGSSGGVSSGSFATGTDATPLEYDYGITKAD